MWAILDCKLGGFAGEIKKTKNLNYHIQLRSTNFKYMKSILFPYFSLTYGEKLTAMAKLLRLAELRQSETVSAQIESICLVYSFATAGGRNLSSLREKLNSSIGEANLEVRQNHMVVASLAVREKIIPKTLDL